VNDEAASANDTVAGTAQDDAAAAKHKVNNDAY
jgi:hypothetical protein